MLTDIETNDVTHSTVKFSRGKLNVELSQSASELGSEERAALVKILINEWYKDRAELISREGLKSLI